MVVEEKSPKQWSVSPINNSSRANLMSNLNNKKNTGEGNESQTIQKLTEIKVNSAVNNSQKHSRVQSAGL